jgi:hypothetical protein
MKHEKRKTIQHEERLSPDIVAFCSLMARIMMRGLRQHDTRLEKFLFLSDPSKHQHKEVPHDPTVE